MKVTIRTVAQEADVSVATVSRVLNSPELVGLETRQRVLSAIERLNFQPNQWARGLGSQRTHTIGVIVPGIDNLFFTELHKGIHKAALEHGMNVLLFDSGRKNPERDLEGFTFLARQQCEGIVFSSAYIEEESYRVISRLGIPVTLALTEAQGTDLAAYKVDDVKASFDAVAYLIARGHRAIGVISGELQDRVAGYSRYQGYRAALEHYQLPFSDNQAAFGDFRFEDGYAGMEKLLAHRRETGITAVFVGGDEMALGAMRCAHEHSLRIPEDMSIIGFDNLAVSNMVTPKLTTVEQPFARIGEEAVRQLVALIEGEASRAGGGTHYLPYRIIGRESVGILKRNGDHDISPDLQGTFVV